MIVLDLIARLDLQVCLKIFRQGQQSGWMVEEIQKWLQEGLKEDLSRHLDQQGEKTKLSFSQQVQYLGRVAKKGLEKQSHFIEDQLCRYSRVLIR